MQEVRGEEEARKEEDDEEEEEEEGVQVKVESVTGSKAHEAPGEADFLTIDDEEQAGEDEEEGEEEEGEEKW